MSITNETMKSYKFLNDMYQDSYFPKNLVEKGEKILIQLCLEIEKTKPENLEDLYKLTHASTEKFNSLAEEFEAADSEIETAARDCIGMDFQAIAEAYGFSADSEELIATRDW
ncbi:DUF5713 family protein [Desulfobotulus sp. H1]|uniref:DUF5713 family protein n=1 Tax=Desulfobotulus pelophilus TaxID=2823377 RepID=A0ABT3NDE4_9BACT|nr:DUF5713 family protein [Desulfobotulus pelophilus]MCW7755445.1 DUF5713 family protein [Desulfobotulus pelophilus]